MAAVTYLDQAPAEFRRRHHRLVDRAINNSKVGYPGRARAANKALLRHWLPQLEPADAARAESTLANLEKQT